MKFSRVAHAAAAGVAAVLLAGCAGGTGAAGPAPLPGGSTLAPPASASSAHGSAQGAAGQSASPALPSAQQPRERPPRTAEPRTETAWLSIPSLGLEDLRVVRYEGTTDDWPGTRIQNRGVAASPYGDKGGVGPGEIGNYLVTAHRLSAGGPLRDLPSLEKGDAVLVSAGGSVYEYVITETRRTSFRSQRSLEEQRAAVPGHPGERPTKAMITISTCATPEDDAAGNFWRDDRGNPEHRIDKIGVLREVSRA